MSGSDRETTDLHARLAAAEAVCDLMATENPYPPYEVMQDFVKWVKDTCIEHAGKPVCVAYPAGFDFMFVYWYLISFVGESPFSFSAVDMKSYAYAKLNTEFRNTTKRNMPKAWFKDLPPHNHNALDDAVEQGMLFMRMRKHAA